MSRELSFAKFGRVAVVLCVVLYAGYIAPIAQAWCDSVECPHSESMDHQPSSPLIGSAHNSKNSGDMDVLCCHEPDFTNSIAMSHTSATWAPVVMPSPVVIVSARIEAPLVQLKRAEPHLSLGSPPPKSFL